MSACVGGLLFSPVAIDIFGLPIRWYALAYMTGFLLGLYLAFQLIKRPPNRPTRDELDGFFIWAVVGVIIGGRLGHTLLWYPEQYLAHPLSILKIWEGGMAFHGGALGVIIAILLYSYRHKLNPILLSDIVTAVVPIGLFFGRIANFINMELPGRPSNVPWAVKFANDPLCVYRHPSQIYEALSEGLVLFIILMVLIYVFKARRRPGLVTGVFLIGYAVARSVSEIFREPEVFTHSLPFDLTWGQILSIPMVLAGLYFIIRAYRLPRIKADDTKPNAS